MIKNEEHKDYVRFGCNRNGGSARQEMIIVDKDGTVDIDVPVTFDYEKITDVIVIDAEDTPITIEGGRFRNICCRACADTDFKNRYVSYQRNIRIQRSNVTIKNLDHKMVDEPEITGLQNESYPYGGFIYIVSTNNVKLLDCDLTGHKTYYEDRSHIANNSAVPMGTTSKQALSTIGQCELMFMYDKMFSEYGHSVGQVLVTKRNVEAEETRTNLINTFEKLFEYGVVPVINENDAIAIEEIVFGDNDTLSANVAKLVGADALMILTDTDGLYDKDPSEEDAKVIPVVETITESLFEVAGGRGSKFGTGGMITKLEAAQIATEAGIDTYVCSGDKPENLYKILEGKQVGTKFEKK